MGETLLAVIYEQDWAGKAIGLATPDDEASLRPSERI